MNKSIPLMISLCAICLALASCQTTAKLTDPCDVLVAIDPAPATNAWLVSHDRPTAQSIARHRGRYAAAGCK